MQEMTLTHHDLDLGGEPIEAMLVTPHSRQVPMTIQELAKADAAICNTIRNALMGATGLNLDELDMDADGTVERTNGSIIVRWTGSRGHRSITTLV